MEFHNRKITKWTVARKANTKQDARALASLDCGHTRSLRCSDKWAGKDKPIGQKIPCYRCPVKNTAKSVKKKAVKVAA